MIQELGVPTIVTAGNWVGLCGQSFKIEHLSIAHVKMRLANWHQSMGVSQGQQLELNGRAWQVETVYPRQVILKLAD